MTEPTASRDEGTSHPTPHRLADRPPVDVATIRTTIRQATDHPTVPTPERLDDLTGRLRRHIGRLLGELDERSDCEHDQRVIVREAACLVRMEPPRGQNRRERWSHIGILAASCKGVLRCWEAQQSRGGDVR
ncbi:hypothetical protein SRB5_44590 [Streptomyces sp. RB5]|uniref:Uncharacterized protein n=1 Tax=Streptomyces smaragdinus TaxID=2585196 RepID=A0A7K0CLD0_9ACTN|nr:DUF6415 family natural product biosynthesis protein [Streptomyces smaragdinus]MQY14295.1 hypothetical protein [Streptomyces smaragdinus]